MLSGVARCGNVRCGRGSCAAQDASCAILQRHQERLAQIQKHQVTLAHPVSTALLSDAEQLRRGGLRHAMHKWQYRLCVIRDLSRETAKVIYTTSPVADLKSTSSDVRSHVLFMS
jgi:hypothetical protein